nr:hypothetical protein [Tanacetum cinerariifolium]
MDVQRINEEVDPDFLSDAHGRTGLVESGDSCESKVKPNRMRELVMTYKAEKVCHEEMVKMPLVDLNVLEVGSFRICMDYRKLSEIAIKNRYHQMRVHEEEIPKTDFRMRYGRFEFTVIPFGLTKAPAVYTKLKEEHESHLKMNLELVKKEKCYVKPNKVEAE